MDTVERAYRHILDAWREAPPTSYEQMSSLLDGYKVYFAYNSGKIENQAITYYDTHAVFEDGVALNYTGDVRTLFEIQNQKKCHELLLDCWAKHCPISAELVLETHATLTNGTYDEGRWNRGERPGTYKLHDYVVGVAETGMPADEVAEVVQELVEELEVVTPDNVLAVAAYFHLSFEAIHPFADGNGRVGRALTNYLLMMNGHPPVIIYDEDKLSYYGAMNAWDEEGDMEPMKQLLMVETVKTWQGKLNGR